jgi:hypothetical protein
LLWISPPLNTITVGIALIWYFSAISRFASVSSLPTFALPVELRGDLVDRRGEHPARHAPLGPEIHEHRALGLQDLGLEVLARELQHMLARHADAP